MKFERLLDIVGRDPLFESSLLLAGDVDPQLVQQQLSRWQRAGRIVQVRRGLYALAPPYRKVEPEPFVVSNHLARGSYVSCESALSHYGLIPDVAQLVVAVGPGRPGHWETPLGRYRVRHLARHLLWGYREEGGALVASPEKALLDLVHLTPGGDDPGFLGSLRLQDLERIDVPALSAAATRAGSPKLLRAARHVAGLARAEAEAFEPL